MNLPRYKSFVERSSKIQTLFILILLILLSVCLAGCGDNVHPPSAQQLIEFENAGPFPPSIDTDRMVRAKIGEGPYRAVAGDALELTMPAVVRFITAKEFGGNNTVMPYISRVNESGNITLPIVGDIEAAGRTLPRIESDIIEAYYPKHVVTRPSVFARVLDYRTAKVSIAGAVRTPGIYSLRSDQMSLVALLMEAGGIIDEGAALIRIIHSDQAMPNSEAVLKTAVQSLKHPANLNKILPAKLAAGTLTNSNRGTQTHYLRLSAKADEVFGQDAAQISAPSKILRAQRITEAGGPRKSDSLVLPIKGFNIPFADIELQDGDSVIVERLQPPLFTVMGLVNNPGNFPYSPDVRYTLMQTMGFAGGLNQIAEPRYATIYRLKRDGTCVSATFPIKGKSKLADASNTLIKPGDIIAVEHTPRTRTALFLDRAFRINIGTYWRLNDSDS